MFRNQRYIFLLSIIGIFKASTLILGVLTLTLAGCAYFYSDWTERYRDFKTVYDQSLNNNVTSEWENLHILCSKPPELVFEQVSLVLTLTFLLCSIINFLSHLIIEIYQKDTLRGLLDLFFHIIGSVAQFLISGLLLSSTFAIENFIKCIQQNIDSSLGVDNDIQQFELKIVAATFCIFNGIVYGFTAARVRLLFIPEPNLLEAQANSLQKSNKIHVPRSESKQMVMIVKQFMANKN